MSEVKPHYFWRAGALVLAFACLVLAFRHIDETLPYPQHIDEPALSNPAVRTLTTGTFHPYEFNYPSLPKYLTSLGMAVGFLKSAGTPDGIHEVAKIGRVGFPFYDVPEVMRGARRLFALLAALSLLATGACAFYASKRASAWVLAPLFLALSPLFFSDAWSYLTVDIVGLAFVALTLACCLHATGQPSLVRSALLPGACAGLAAASKYTLAVVCVSVFVGILFYLPRHKLWACGAALLAMAAAFVLTVPYALLDLPGFLNGLAFDAFHYSSGHAGANVEPGWREAVAYTRDLLDAFGLPALLTAEVGACVWLLRDFRRFVTLSAYALALLRMLFAQRVHFDRNALPVFVWVAACASYGSVFLYERSVLLLARRGANARWVGPAVAVVVCLAVIPFWRVRTWLEDRTDSRLLAESWLAREVPARWTIVLPNELHWRPSEIRARARDLDFAAGDDEASLRALIDSVPRPAAIVVPLWGADARRPGRTKADALNRAARELTEVAAFGEHPVLVNYVESAPEGDPALFIATLGGKLPP